MTHSGISGQGGYNRLCGACVPGDANTLAGPGRTIGYRSAFSQIETAGAYTSRWTSWGPRRGDVPIDGHCRSVPGQGGGHIPSIRGSFRAGTSFQGFAA